MVTTKKEPNSAAAAATALLTLLRSTSTLLSKRDSARNPGSDGTINDAMVCHLTDSRPGTHTPRHVEEGVAGPAVVRRRQGRAADPRVALCVVTRRPRAAWETLRPHMNAVPNRHVGKAKYDGNNDAPCSAPSFPPGRTTAAALLARASAWAPCATAVAVMSRGEAA